MKAGEIYMLNIEARADEPMPYTDAYLAKVDSRHVARSGAEAVAVQRQPLHYNWHRHWDYGNGDTGNQGSGICLDIARWGSRRSTSTR